MITVYKATTASDGSAILELRGKSTDTKPTETCEGFNVGNGSTFYEIDTGDLYMFDADAGEWVEQ